MHIFSDQREKDVYVQSVLEELQSKYLHVYPFLTDDEFRDLFGEKMLHAMTTLNCPQENCGRCDIDINCPFYSRMLDRCGIEPYKPVHCRLWHCYECGPAETVRDIRELTAIFADQMGPEAMAWEIKNDLEQGRLSQGAAREKFEKLIKDFRDFKNDMP